MLELYRADVPGDRPRWDLLWLKVALPSVKQHGPMATPSHRTTRSDEFTTLDCFACWADICNATTRIDLLV